MGMRERYREVEVEDKDGGVLDKGIRCDEMRLDCDFVAVRT